MDISARELARHMLSQIFRVKVSRMESIPKFLSKKDVSDILGVSLPTINRRIADSTIPHIKLGSRVLIPAVFLDELAAKALSGQEV